MHNPDVCGGCGSAIRGDESVTKNVVHFARNRKNIYRFVTRATQISRKQAVWNDFPLAVFQTIPGGVHSKPTHRGGTACWQRRLTLTTANDVGKFLQLNLVPAWKKVKKCTSQAMVTTSDDIKVITPPLKLTHCIKNDGTYCMEATLRVTYNVTTISGDGRIKIATDHPARRCDWGVPQHKRKFNWQLETELHAIIPACELVAPGAPNRHLLEAERDRVQRKYNEYYAIETDPEEIFMVEREEGDARRSARLQDQERAVTVVHQEASDYDDDSSDGDYSEDENIVQVPSEL